jgi:hypothetical protein
MLEAGRTSIKTDDTQQVSTIPEKKNLNRKRYGGARRNLEKREELDGSRYNALNPRNALPHLKTLPTK